MVMLTAPNNRGFEKSARKLFVTGMFPLTTPAYMLLRLQDGGLDDIVLEDSDDEGDDRPALGYSTHDGDGKLSTICATEEQYKK